MLTALSGVALTIYRWPWVETKEGARFPPEEWKTTYRRDWRGRPIKHGREQFTYNGQMRQVDHYYDGQLNGLRQFFDYDGKLRREGTCRHGKLHGPYRAGDGTTWLWQGQYKNGQLDGEWQGIVERWWVEEPVPTGFGGNFVMDQDSFDDSALKYPKEPVRVTAQWANGKRTGKWTWRALDETTLFTAQFENDELVRWNDEPVVEQFLAWLQSPAVNEPRLVSFFQEAKANYWEYRPTWSPGIHYEIKGSQRAPEVVGQNFIAGAIWNCQPQRSLASSLCEEVLRNGYGFDYRYGGLWLVPQAEPEPPFVEPTGYGNIRFEPGSAQERDWNAQLEVLSVDADGFDKACFQRLFEQTSIEVDLTALSPVRYDGTKKVAENVFARRRRDAVGYVLSETGCRIEQEGNRLVVRPQEKRTEAQRTANPLETPRVLPF